MNLRVLKGISLSQTHLRIQSCKLRTSTRSKMRLPYTDPSSSAFPSDTTTREIVSRVEARRAPRPLQALDLTLLHSPHVADGWNSFLGAVRTKTSLADDIREIAICRVAVCNSAWYEWGHHAPLAEKGGVSPAGMKILGQKEPKEDGEGLSEKQWAVVRYTDAMTRNVAVDDKIFAQLKEYFTDQEVVEITATVCFFPFCLLSC
jgi:alkylhydroperoxidase family enzyme